MKFSVAKEIILEAFNTTSKAAASKSTIPALEGLLLELSDNKLTVTGYNLEIGIRTEIAMSVAKAEACGILRFWMARMKILLPIKTQSVPPSICGMTYEPIAGMNTINTADTIPWRTPGTKIFWKA